MNAAKPKGPAVGCRHCDGTMEVLSVKKHSGKWPLILIVAGLFCFFFLGGPLLGVPMLLLGIYMYTAQVTISYCEQCGHYFRVWLKEKD